jgi:spermidine synthase
MVFNLSIIFTFQVLCGLLYRQIGLLVAVFMAGIASGSLLMTARLRKPRKEPFLFLQSELAVILFSLLLPYLFFALAGRFQETSTGALFQAVFWSASFLSGILTGLQFPLATKIYLDHSSTKGTIGRTAGLIYGVDLLGGFFGGLLGGVLFLPVLGLKETCFLMAIIKMSSFLLFFVFTRTHK